MKRDFPYHPLLAALFPVLFLWANNPADARIQDIWLPLTAFWAATIALWSVAGLLVRRIAPAALITTILLLMFSSYGHVFVLLRGASFADQIVGRTRFLFPAWLFIMVLTVTIVFLKRGLDFSRITKYTNLFSLILIFMTGAQITASQINHSAFSAKPPEPTGETFDGNETETADSNRDKPDIYYIIPDSYSASSTLKNDFGFDNGEFENDLRAKGFFIASQSTSNYAFTSLSLASSLNMEYLDFTGLNRDANSLDGSPVSTMMADNAVMRFLKREGYVIINAGSWWGHTYSNPNADINLRATRLNEFSMKVLEGTMLFPFSEEFVADDLREKVLFTFRNLGEIPKMKAATFTLAHVISPHPPYLFGADGTPLPTLQRILKKSDPRSQYRDQLIYINTLIRAAVDSILVHSSKPPVIIIQGDHGAAYTYLPYGASQVFPDDHYLRAQMRIFNAYLLPGLDTLEIPNTITPVNSFRIVLNAYFGANLPLLPDENFYSTKGRPLMLFNVTEKVASPE